MISSVPAQSSGTSVSLNKPGSDGGQSKGTQPNQSSQHLSHHAVGSGTYIILWSQPVLTIQSVYRNIAALKVATKQPLQLQEFYSSCTLEMWALEDLQNK